MVYNLLLTKSIFFDAPDLESLNAHSRLFRLFLCPLVLRNAWFERLGICAYRIVIFYLSYCLTNDRSSPDESKSSFCCKTKTTLRVSFLFFLTWKRELCLWGGVYHRVKTTSSSSSSTLVDTRGSPTTIPSTFPNNRTFFLVYLGCFCFLANSQLADGWDPLLGQYFCTLTKKD